MEFFVGKVGIIELVNTELLNQTLLGLFMTFSFPGFDSIWTLGVLGVSSDAARQAIYFCKYFLTKFAFSFSRSSL